MSARLWLIVDPPSAAPTSPPPVPDNSSILVLSTNNQPRPYRQANIPDKHISQTGTHSRQAYIPGKKQGTYSRQATNACLGGVKGQVCSEIGVNNNDNHSNTRSGFGLRKGHRCNEYALHFVQFPYSCTTVCIFSHNKVYIDAHLCAFWQCAAHEIKFMAWCAGL